MDIVSYLKDKAKKDLLKDKQNNEAYEKKLKELTDYLESNKNASSTPSYERFEYDSTSDDELVKAAEDELKDYANSNEKAIRDEYAEREKELNKSRESSKNLYDESAEKLKDAYAKMSETLGNDALKRGLARSSIALNGQIAASEAYRDSASSLVDEYNRKLSDIDEELDGLGAELGKALDSFKIGYAAKLTERINELKSEREKNNREAIEYNNKMLQQEYNEKTAAANKNKYLTESEKAAWNDYEKDLYEKVYDVLASLTKEQAKRMFNEQKSLIRDTFSDAYYYSLYTRFM